MTHLSERVYYLYKITNQINDKVYIGISHDPDARFKAHKYKSSCCTKLVRAFSKYGYDNFTMTVLCAGSEDYILDLEKKAILAFNSIENGYNLILGNPRSGGASLSEEVRQKISTSLLDYYSERDSSQKGVIKGPKEPDKAVFVSGFWFPNFHIALDVLRLNSKTYYKWLSNNTLGDVQHLSKDNVVDSPAYVGGFWFDSLIRASESLNQKISTLKKRLKTNNVEQKNNKTYKTGESNHMTGRFGALHHNSREVYVDGVLYDSVSSAAKQTRYSKKMIYSRIKKGVEGFCYVTKENKQ